MRQEDRLDLFDSEVLEGRFDALRLVAWVNEESPRLLLAGANDVGVLLDRADGQPADVETAHRALPRAFCAIRRL